MWGLSEALVLVRALQPELLALNYHVLLAGGVLNKGFSDKDLDLFFIPLNGHDADAYGIRCKLAELLGAPGEVLRDSPDYHPHDMWHCKEMLKYDYEGKRIDAFIL